MFGTIVNCIAVIVGGTFGLILQGRLKENISTAIMNGLALCVIYIGISGALKGEDTLQMIICIALGALVGELIDIDKKLKNLGDYLEGKFIKGEKRVSIAEGFVASSLLFCVGAMAIVGSLESGLQGNYDTLFAKSILDGISSVIFTSTLGIGVFFSSGSILIYQGSITLLAGVVGKYLSPIVILNMSAVGSLLILGLGLNMLGITKIKVGNLLPAMFIPIIFGIFI